MRKLKIIKYILLFAILCGSNLLPQNTFSQSTLNISTIGRSAIARNSAKIEFAFSDKGVKLGNQVFLRVFKDKSKLELWVKAKNNKFKYIRQYKICGLNTANIPTGIYYIRNSNIFTGNAKNLKIGTDYPNIYNIEKKQKGIINI
ncbi:MAG: hypothetical protein J0L55_15515, partial [Caulobacterales bacterium]|nr:hypothetical protein [Caulobacterales bacterium]